MYWIVTESIKNSATMLPIDNWFYSTLFRMSNILLEKNIADRNQLRKAAIDFFILTHSSFSGFFWDALNEYIFSFHTDIGTIAVYEKKSIYYKRIVYT